MTDPKVLSKEDISEFKSNFETNDKNLFAQNVVHEHGPQTACLNPKAKLAISDNVFSHTIDDMSPGTNQQSSGRCWIFAGLNAMRLPLKKNKKLTEFEFSQNYLFFWHKIETSNNFLHTIYKIYKDSPNEKPEGRLLSRLLGNPCSDGGNWKSFSNLVAKYGVMPKECFPDNDSCKFSYAMNDILKSKLQQFAFELSKVVEVMTEEEIETRIKAYMNTIYQIVGICLGIPPDTFTWRFKDEDKNQQKIGPITPLEFYNDHVKPHFDVSTKVHLSADPRPSMLVGQTYKNEFAGDMVGAEDDCILNVEMETLMKIASKSIQEGVAVIFSGYFSEFIHDKYLDTDLFNYKLVFDTDVFTSMTKANRLIFSKDTPNHMALLTGVDIDETTENPLKWRVENSSGDNQYLTMTNAWFEEFGFGIIVDQSHCSQEILDGFKTTPIILPFWNSLASC